MSKILNMKFGQKMEKSPIPGRAKLLAIENRENGEDQMYNRQFVYCTNTNARCYLRPDARCNLRPN